MHFAPFGKARSKAVPTARRLRRSAREWRAAVLSAWPLVAGTVLCLADWVSTEDLGFLGSIGTDPNSMVPMSPVVRGRLSRYHPGAAYREPGH